MAGKEGGFEVEGVGFHQFSGMSEAEELAGSFDGKLTAAARGGVVLTAGGIGNGVGYCGFGFHFFSFLSQRWVYPTPGVFLQEWQTKGLGVTWRVRVANTGLKVAFVSVVCGGAARVALRGSG